MIQLRGYYQPQRWQWLLHRPLPRPAIFGALALSAAAQIAFVVGLPLFLAAICTDALSFRTVDLRHYLAIVFLVEIGIIAWLVVASVMFSTRWTNIVVAILPCILLMHRMTAIAAVLLAGGVMVLYALIAYCNFKPDRKAPPAGLRASLIVALPLVIGNFLVILVLGAVAFASVLKLSGTVPAKQPPRGSSFESLVRLESAKRMKHLVAKLDDPRRLEWLRELEVAPVYPVLPNINHFAKRQQLSNEYTPRPYVAPGRVRWSFDHDLMRFVGIDADTGEFREQRGLYGKGDLTPFPSVPYAGHDYLFTPQQIHAFDAHAMHYPVRAILQAPEKVASEPKRIERRLYMRSDRRLIAYQSDRLGPDGLFVELFSIALPLQRGQSGWIDVLPLTGTTLIMIAGQTKTQEGRRVNVVQLYAVDRYDQLTLLTDRRQPEAKLEQTWVNQMGWLISPFLYGSGYAIGPLLAAQSLPLVWEQATSTLVAPVGWAALAVMILTGIVAWMWLRRRSHRTALAWSVASVLLGLPALATLILLYPRQHLLAKE